MPGAADTFLKVSLAISVLAAAGSVGYYYVVYLPDRDASLARQVRLEKANAEYVRQAEQQAEQSRQQAAEERRASEQAAIKFAYQSCIDRSAEAYNLSWATTCKRLADENTKNRAECITKGNTYCDSAYKKSDASPNCLIPSALASTINGTLEKGRDRCLQESKSGLQ